MFSFKEFAISEGLIDDFKEKLQKQLMGTSDGPLHAPAGTKEGGQFISKNQILHRTVSDYLQQLHVNSGDAWNQETSMRLAKESAEAIFEIQDIIDDMMKNRDKYSKGSDAPKPKTWDDLSSYAQEKIEAKWKENNYDSFHDSEVDNWYQNDGLNDARRTLLYELENDDKVEWMEDTLQEIVDDYNGDHEERIPYKIEDLMAAIELRQKYEGEGPIKEIEWDDEALKTPINLKYDPEKQQSLPGVEAPKLSSYLTKEMRDFIQKKLCKAAEEKADDMLSRGEVEPDSYCIEEMVKETLDTVWNDMDDNEKYSYGVEHELIESGDDEDEDLGEYAPPEKVPTEFDPFAENFHSGTTQNINNRALARAVSIERAYQILVRRGLVKKNADKAEIRAFLIECDADIWKEWKASSTTKKGCMLQLAVADELGGRMNWDQVTKKMYSDGSLRKDADLLYKRIGGYQGLLAMIRSKWETTQYWLDKAGKNNFLVYRSYSVSVSRTYPEDEEIKIREVHGVPYKQLPFETMSRNGCFSTSVDAAVVNNWGSSGNRRVRIYIPRTAAISIPVYGINVFNEKEVVVAGTSWHGWDLWYGPAPSDDKPTPLLYPHEVKK